MLLVERHFINKNHPNITEIDKISFMSKNLYNYALYNQNQHYKLTNTYLNYNDLDKLLQKHETYKALPAKVSQQILLKLHKNWLSYFALVKKDNNAKPPKYKHKTKGRNQLTYTKQAIGKNNKLSKTNIIVNTKQENIQEIRIINKRFGYFIEVVYEKKEEKLKVNNNVASGDLGLNNLLSITSNCAKALIINGRIIKSINQHYNKQLSRITSPKRKEKLLRKRYFRINNYFHHTSKLIVEYCLKHNISKFIIGYNEGWKQDINLGKKTNQNFCFVPFLELVKQIEYKCKLIGIEVIRVEESYTSKASYFDNDVCTNYNSSTKGEYKFSGKRVKRGLYRCQDGFEFNADLNGSLNIGKKVVHDYVVDKSQVVWPLRINSLKNNFYSLL